MTLMRPTKILLIDGFTYGIRPEISRRLWNTAKKIIADNNMTLFAVMEDPNLEFEFFNRTLVMSGGKIVLDVNGENRVNTNFNNFVEIVNIDPRMKPQKSSELIVST